MFAQLLPHIQIFIVCLFHWTLKHSMIHLTHPRFNPSFCKCNKPKMSDEINLYSSYFTKLYLRNHNIQHRQNIVNVILLLRFLHSLHWQIKHQSFITFSFKNKIITVICIQNHIANIYFVGELISFIPFSSKTRSSHSCSFK